MPSRDPFINAANKLIASVWRDLQRDSFRSEKAAAEANPVKYRNSRVFDGGLAYSYFYAGTNGHGQVVRFCYSRNRNVAGYFLIWRQVHSKKGWKRDQWDSTTSKRAAVRVAEELAAKFKAAMSSRSAGTGVSSSLPALAGDQ